MTDVAPNSFQGTPGHQNKRGRNEKMDCLADRKVRERHQVCIRSCVRRKLPTGRLESGIVLTLCYQRLPVLIHHALVAPGMLT